MEKNGCEWVSPDKDTPVAPLDTITVRLPCHHNNENTMRYFKQGNGLIVCGRSECISKLSISRLQDAREQIFKDSLPELWSKLPKQVKRQLANQPIKEKLTCPHCKTKLSLGHDIASVVAFLKKHEGFYCIHCHNTGTTITDNPYTAGTILQSKESIQEIITKTGFGDPDKWHL